MKTIFILIVLSLINALGTSMLAQSHDVADPESQAIRNTALDYVHGFYTADAERMERAVHPELAKRTVFTDPKTGKSTLDQMSAMTLVQRTRSGNGKRIPEGRRQEDITILDRYQNVAVVKIVAADWVDYLQVAKFNGEWKIINVLWELKPKDAGQSK